MKNRTGFTLTEILLAVLVVAIIGVALASLTSAASRESGVGSSKVMLRNSMSRALRQLRQDIHEASRVLYVRGPIDVIGENVTQIPLLMIGKNVRLDGSAVAGNTRTYIVYCFKPGTVTATAGGAAVVPDGALDEGTIYRQQFTQNTAYTFPEGSNAPSCRAYQDSDIWLPHVKFIPNSTTSPNNYPVPLFGVSGYSATYSTNDTTDTNLPDNLGSLLRLNMILELPSSPVVNDVTEERFALPNGFSTTVQS